MECVATLPMKTDGIYFSKMSADDTTDELYSTRFGVVMCVSTCTIWMLIGFALGVGFIHNS